MIAEGTYGPAVVGMKAGKTPVQVSEARQAWVSNNFAEVEGVVSPDWLRWVAVTLYPHLLQVAERHEVKSEFKDGRPGGGQRLSRVDPGRPGVPDAVLAQMREVYDHFSLPRFGEQLAEDLKPLVDEVLGGSVQYERVYFLLYGPDDYISPHDDKQTGQRVNVQLPICIDGLAGLRVHHGDWITHIDRAGLLRFLGPGVWHEVLPLIGQPNAMRMNITLRYWLTTP
jgi:hypothetical protein